MLLFKIIEKTAIDKFITQELLIEMQYNLISSILIPYEAWYSNRFIPTSTIGSIQDDNMIFIINSILVVNMVLFKSQGS